MDPAWREVHDASDSATRKRSRLEACGPFKTQLSASKAPLARMALNWRLLVVHLSYARSGRGLIGVCGVHLGAEHRSTILHHAPRRPPFTLGCGLLHGSLKILTRRLGATMRFHARGTACCDRDYWRVGRAPAAGGPSGPRVGAAFALRQQSTPNRRGADQLS